MHQNNYSVRADIENMLKAAGIPRGTWARAANLSKKTNSRAEESDTGAFNWILTTEKPTVVFDWERWDLVEEVLVADGMLVPANNQVVLLDSHSRYSAKDVLGHVKNFTEDISGEYPARAGDVYFAQDQESASIRSKVADGHITDGSVGYQPLRSVWVPEGEEVSVGGRIFMGGESGMRVTYQWLLREFSITPIGADVLAKVRQLQQKNSK